MAYIGSGTLIALLRRVGTQVKAGVDWRTIWQREAASGPSALRPHAAIVAERLAAGDSLADGVRACGTYFPPLVRDLVDVGEKTGRLDDILAGLAEHYEHLQSLRRGFLLGILWPAIQLAGAAGVIGLLILILGAISSRTGGAPIDLLGFGLVGVTGFIKYVFFLAFVAGTITFVVLSVIRGWWGPVPMELAMRLPVIGACLRAGALSRLAWTLSLTLDAGVDARGALRMAFRATQNPYYLSKAKVADAAVEEGCEFHDALRRTGVFPDEFLHGLETAEVSGTYGRSLARLADEYRDRAKTAARVLAVASTVAVWVLAGAILIGLIFRFAFFYIDLVYGSLKGL
jgi:type II secretory pathway component PulF